MKLPNFELAFIDRNKLWNELQALYQFEKRMRQMGSRGTALPCPYEEFMCRKHYLNWYYQPINSLNSITNP
ncbi:hypothetical protein [Tolypothrix sp. VBCCA 56010]|uniref:hypothetical protein n=1 Tax=Tolypothrix sp. VBCCA 56010 TaxID=3137731 RepID=UPI003D7DD022